MLRPSIRHNNISYTYTFPIKRFSVDSLIFRPMPCRDIPPISMVRQTDQSFVILLL